MFKTEIKFYHSFKEVKVCHQVRLKTTVHKIHSALESVRQKETAAIQFTTFSSYHQNYFNQLQSTIVFISYFNQLKSYANLRKVL